MADRTPYDDLLQQDTAQALRSSMSTAVDRQPDVEARLQTLARDYQMPVEAVRVRQTEIERKARLDAVDYDTLAREFPKTANTLADPLRAGVAHDDVDNMTMLERIGGGLKATAKYLFSAPDNRNTLMGDLGAGIFRLSRNSAGVFRAGFEGAAPALDALEPVQAIGGNPLRRVAEGFDMLAQQAGARADQLSPPQQDIVGSGVSSGVQSLAQQAPALALSVFNPFAGMLLLAGGSGGGSYQAAREKGVSPMRSLGYGLSDAVVEYATEKIPMSRLLGDLKQGAPILQTLLRNAATEVPGEQVATVLQDLNEWATINPDKPFSDYLAERPSAAAQTLIATLVGVGGNVALGSAVQTVADRAAGVERDVQQAEAHAKVLGEFAKLAEASKVRERDPASFATFLQTLTEDGVPNVYVDAKALLQAADVNEVALALPSVAEQIAEAAATGGDVVIPTAELLTAGPGQTFMQTLLDNARTAPDAMSAVEAREYMQSKGDQLKADIDQVLQKQEQDASWQEMRNQLRDEFKAQLDQVKRFTGDVNTQYANLLANFYAVTAARLGVTPQELATRYGLRVQSRGVEGGQQLDQGAQLDDVRRQWDEAGIQHSLLESGDNITLGKIVVPQEGRGAGKGTAAMQALVDYADRAGKNIVLSPSADFGGNKARLTKFYKRFGFVENKGKNRAFTVSESMYRPAPGKVLQQEARGSINLPDDLTRSPAIISLFQGADLSTFLHESGHFFLEVQMDLAARIQAQIAEGGTVSEGEQSIVNDANALLAWFGVKGDENRTPLQTWATMDLETKRPLHEQFARGFEAYAFEGNAPSLELQGMFQKFRAWLLAVYKELRALRVELTDDVRGVMDRMLATTEAIQTAEAARRLGPLFKTAEEAGMTLDEFKAYHDLATDASQVAIEELQARGLRDMKWLQGAKDRKLREMQKLHDSLRREVRAEVRREVMGQPVYRAWQFLTGKGAPDETAQPADKAKASKELDVINDDLLAAIAKLGGLRKEEVVGLWGADPKEKVESGVFGAPVLRREGGLDVDTMGERLVEAGYLRPDENGKHDPQEFEEAFAAALRGETVYSMWHEYSRPDDAEPAQQLPENVAFGKLDTREMEARYGAAEGAPWRKLQAARMTSTSRGISADVIAEVNGFGSGDEMVKALIDAEPPQSVIEGMTDQRMLERFGDLGTPEGLQRAVDSAIHNEARARFLSTEIAALERGMRVRADTGRVNANGQRVTVDIMAQVAKQQAERIVGATKVKNLRPSQYTNAETRAARAAERAMLAGKTEDALAEKRHQLINLQAARAATKAQEDVEKITAYLRRFNDKPKGLDADYYDQIAQLLNRYEFTRVSLRDIDRRMNMRTWLRSQIKAGTLPDIDPALFLSPAQVAAYQRESQSKDEDGTLIYDEVEQVALLGAYIDQAEGKHYKEMTVDELRGLRDTVRQIEKLGRVKNTLLTAKKNRDFQAVRDEVADSIYANANGRQADARTPAPGSFAAWFKKVKDFGAAHIKAATWARVFDGGKDGGPVWEYFIRPANEAADMETRMRAEATEKLHAILAPVLAKPMGGKGTHFPTIGRAMNREQVFAMALNMGNEGNIQRMLDGEGWTVQQIQPALATLSAADWQAVQAVWDHFESYRPLIGAKERRIYGKEPAWVEPMPLSAVTSDGQTVQLRGGYYPVKYDPLANNRAEQHADAEDAKRQMQAAYTSATTRRGFTKSRAEAVKNRPLLYSLAGVYSGVNDVIHDLAFHEWLIDVNKLLRSDKINDAIRTTYGPEAVRQLKTWIEDTARGEQGLQAELDSMLGRLRQGVSIAGLGFNVMSAAMQPLGLSQSVVRIGGKWVGKGVAQYLAAPREKARWVNERSDFMASRARTRFRELNELRAQVEGEHPVRTWASNAAFFMMTRMQMTVDIPTWLGAYEKAMAAGNTEERAGQLADQAVIDSQGGGQMKDLAAIERGGPAQKLFTVFYSFFNTALNVGVAQTMTEKSRAKLAADYLLLYSVPAVLGALLKDALTPGDSGDWDDLESILHKLIGEQLGYLFGLMVGVREFGEAAKSAMGLVEHSRDYQGPAGVRMIADTYSLAKQVSQGELDDSFRKASINVLGDLFGLPSAQINRTVTGAQALAEGETDNPFALAFGYQQP